MTDDRCTVKQPIGVFDSGLGALTVLRSMTSRPAFPCRSSGSSSQVHVLAQRLPAPVRAAGVDTLVLGCTHDPLLARTIGDVIGREVVLVSSADETAFMVRELLGAGRSGAEPPARHAFLTSGDVATFRHLGACFLGPEVEAVEAWSWS
jgi:glutamate racemase